MHQVVIDHADMCHALTRASLGTDRRDVVASVLVLTDAINRVQKTLEALQTLAENATSQPQQERTEP